MVVTLAERQATQRSRQLELLAVELLRSLKSSCQTAHALGRRQLTWGAVVPGVQAGQEEDMDDVLAMLDQKMTEDQKLGPSFKKIEWCKAQAPTEWVWMISDLHCDQKGNAEWCQLLDDAEFQEDVLIVAGNVAETYRAVIQSLKVLRGKFRRVFYVPGNRDLALNASEVRTSRFPDSIAKLLALLKACEEIEVDVLPAAIGQDVYVVPLFSWYNAEFAKRSRPDPNIGFDSQCVWPLDQHQLWKWMLKLNEAHLHVYRGTVLTVSHFLPLTTLPFDAAGKQAQAMGCEEIEDQLRKVRSSAHVYGHSTIRSLQVHGGTTFGNHALGLVTDENEVPAGPRLLFDGAKGVVKSSA